MDGKKKFTPYDVRRVINDRRAEFEQKTAEIIKLRTESAKLKETFERETRR